MILRKTDGERTDVKMNGELGLKLYDNDGTTLVPIEDGPISADAENAAVPDEASANNGRGLRNLRRGLCGLLAVAGVLSYGYLGYRGAIYLASDGLSRAVFDGVFGGRIAAVTPLPVPEETLPPAEDEADAEYLTLSSEDIGITDPDVVFNETGYDPDSESVAAWATPYSTGDTVLVIHTHGTEAYAPEGDVPADEDFRSDDPESSIVAVGAAFAENLRERGINVIHCREMFDRESYIDAYAESASAVAEYMGEYPGIAYVIDIHRDAVIRRDGTVVRSDGGSGAQLMIVCGTDEMGADFPRWRENYAFGREYQRLLFERDPRLVRHMNLRGASFNQQLCEHYLLLEVGTCGNTLAEAISAARTAADSFADLLLG